MLACKARGNLINGRIDFKKNHNHGVEPENVEYQQCEKFKDDLWLETVTIEDSLRIIWDHVALLNLEAAIILRFASIERQMSRWHRQNHSQNPNSLLHYDELINMEQWQRYRVYNNGEIHVHTIVVDETRSVTIFGDIQLLIKHTSSLLQKITWVGSFPANDIEQSFNWIIRNTAPDTLAFFGNDFFDYYRNYWLNRVDRFLVHNQIYRTSNFIEAYHRVLSIRFGIHPGLWAFTVRRTVRQEYINRVQVIQRMWELCGNGSLNMARFFSCTNHVSASFGNDILFNDPDQVNLFLTLAVHNRDIKNFAHTLIMIKTYIFFQAIQPQNIDDQVVIIPELDDQLPIPIFRRDINREENLQIYILGNIALSLCPRCNHSILNVVSLPCRHWFACTTCTTALALEAFGPPRAQIF
ncbi:uncharacterized protein LOC122859892 [Aphidius gifuensis]|uniref:uncharacterized protein LOC122859892 n=1 Tax=Aphidius gifuensis TaxID=684658 RepID=UPI001CDD730F|nr:uncharacterized protein LOC122859892 [Aphidius gifuensis]